MQILAILKMRNIRIVNILEIIYPMNIRVGEYEYIRYQIFDLIFECRTKYRSLIQNAHQLDKLAP